MCWASTLAASVPPLLLNPGHYTFQPGKAVCLYPFEANLPFTIFMDVVYIGVPMHIMACCYYKVYKAVATSNRKFQTQPNRNATQLSANVEEAKVTKTLAGKKASFVTH